MTARTSPRRAAVAFGVVRREVLKALSAALGLALLPRVAAGQSGDGACSDPSDLTSASKGRLLEVSIHDPERTHIDPSKPALIFLEPIDAGTPTVLQRDRGRLTFAGEVSKGRYRLHARVEGYLPVTETIDVQAPGLAISIYLGKPGWPSFHVGQSLYSFEPRENLLGLAFDEPVTADGRKRLALQLGKFDLVPYTLVDPLSGAKTEWAAGNSIALFRTRLAGQTIFWSSPDRRPSVDFFRRLASALSGQKVRIGMPIDTRPGRVKILDNHYIVQCRPGTPAGVVERLAKSSAASMERVAAFADLWLFTFADPGNYLRHLRAAEGLRHDASVVYAEPSVILELQPHTGPQAEGSQGQPIESPATDCATSGPGPLTADPWSPCQGALLLQGVPDAWCLVEQIAGSRYGLPTVCVASVDVGINKAHPDVNLGLLRYIKLCDSCADTPIDGNPHGMSIYGIVSAQPGNAVGTSGIAPGVAHLAVMHKRAWSDPPWYGQMLLWLAGLETSADFPALGDAPPDVINLSHGIEDYPSTPPIAQALARLATEGRVKAGAPLGTIVVCSAGNIPTDITGTQVVASDPNVIAVGNTLPPDGNGEEVLVQNSNFGLRIDLCAQGEGAPSLLADPNQPPPSTAGCTPSPPSAGALAFSGTSAAAPMVSATAGLMLSVNPNLTLQQVRDALWQSARCIDAANGQWSGHRSYKYGSGRLDVHGAVQKATQV